MPEGREPRQEYTITRSWLEKLQAAAGEGDHEMVEGMLRHALNIGGPRIPSPEEWSAQCAAQNAHGLITEDWLKSVGFKWHQFDRQPTKQWCLWLAGCVDCGKPWRFSGSEDFGIELAYGGDAADPWFFCWFRGDSAGRYHRFIHVRHLRYQHEVIALVTALTGFPWNPENHIYGSVRCPKCGDAWRVEEARRIDLEARRNRAKWADIEKDDSRGRALPEHMQAAIDGGKAK